MNSPFCKRIKFAGNLRFILNVGKWEYTFIPIFQSSIHFFPPLEPPLLLPPLEEPDFVELFPLPPPDGFPVVLGAFFNPLDFAIFLEFG